MGLFGGSSRVNSYVNNTTNVSVDPTIEVDVGTIAQGTTDAASILADALLNAATGGATGLINLGEQLAGASSGLGSQSAQTFGNSVQNSTLNISFVVLIAAAMLSIALVKSK